MINPPTHQMTPQIGTTRSQVTHVVLRHERESPK